ncbi:hypothetical protein WISP_52146 [Willisornis vidua]|uniref:Uncharacterized protein n=1 Tax=Willisornis vidua TaxID=1566151 RepID=A0ABQ9DIH0_9PASS|nr:hypothetical protein WISP_52146 [Willisornis vidua]
MPRQTSHSHQEIPPQRNGISREPLSSSASKLVPSAKGKPGGAEHVVPTLECIRMLLMEGQDSQRDSAMPQNQGTSHFHKIHNLPLNGQLTPENHYPDDENMFQLPVEKTEFWTDFQQNIDATSLKKRRHREKEKCSFSTGRRSRSEVKSNPQTPPARDGLGANKVG